MWKLTKPALFSMDAESAHRAAIAVNHFLASLGSPGIIALRAFSGTPPVAGEATRVFNMDFRSRVGLAAGFDKNAEILAALPWLGFGFAEIGTVTPRPQEGNPRPRLFRRPEDHVLFNRMGFNNDGATVIAERVARAREFLPENFRVGVNIGKNKDTSAEDAAGDYAAALAPFSEDSVDYVVVNVSSPNTPGLRDLQTVEAIKPILDAVHGVLDKWRRRPPLLLKLAPELTGHGLGKLMRELESSRLEGWILTNTLGGDRKDPNGSVVSGGYSGSLLSELSYKALKEGRSVTTKPIVSVGGIMSGAEAKRRIEAGAQLVQLYTGWIYGGPRFPSEVTRYLQASPRTALPAK